VSFDCPLFSHFGIFGSVFSKTESATTDKSYPGLSILLLRRYSHTALLCIIIEKTDGLPDFHSTTALFPTRWQLLEISRQFSLDKNYRLEYLLR